MSAIEAGTMAAAAGGIRSATERLAGVARGIATDPDPARFPEDAVVMKESVAAVKAGVAVIKAGDELLGSLLDRIG